MCVCVCLHCSSTSITCIGQKSWYWVGCTHSDGDAPAVAQKLSVFILYLNAWVGLLDTAEQGNELKSFGGGVYRGAVPGHSHLLGGSSGWYFLHTANSHPSTRRRFCHFRGSETLECLSQLYSHQQHTFAFHLLDSLRASSASQHLQYPPPPPCGFTSVPQSPSIFTFKWEKASASASSSSSASLIMSLPYFTEHSELQLHQFSCSVVVLFFFTTKYNPTEWMYHTSLSTYLLAGI